MFITFLVVGTTIAVSSNSWFLAWMGLEINLMSMVPLFIHKIRTNHTELCIKYFLPQAMASVIIILYAAMDLIITSYPIYRFIYLILIFALLIKLGLPPFHFWFPQIINKMGWSLCILIISWQKLAPFILISTILTNGILSLIIISSAIIGALGGFNQNLTKLIITYSSISHGAWILPLVSFRIQAWSFYFVIYCFISLTLVYLVKSASLLKISNLSYKYPQYFSKLSFSITLMSLGGLPPLLGFIAKLNAIFVIANFSRIPVLLSLIASSLVSLFYYIKLTYRRLTIYPSKLFKSIKITANKSLLNLIFYTVVAGNIATPLIVSLI